MGHPNEEVDNFDSTLIHSKIALLSVWNRDDVQNRNLDDN